MIGLKNVVIVRGERTVLDGVSMHIDPGEFVCVQGPSACGKSVLLSLLVGAENPTTGNVTVDGVDLAAIPRPALQLFRRKVGVVWQDRKLLSARTVSENIAYSMELAGMDEKAMAARTKELLAALGLTHRKDALPHELSAGEKTRVAIARAVAHKPLILLVDEPLRDLEPDQAQAAIRLLRELHAAGSSVLFATRDPATAASLGARIVRMENGKIESAGMRVRTPRQQEPMEPKEIVKAQVEAIEKRRKIRVTAIHSEG